MVAWPQNNVKIRQNAVLSLMMLLLNPIISDMSTVRSEFAAGVISIAPLLLGVVPFGMIYGIVAIEAGLTELEAQAMSVIVFGGSAQFLMAQLFGIGTPALIIIITAVMINLRHGLYSASITPYVNHLSPTWRRLLAYLLTDEAYAVTIRHYQRGDRLDHKHWFFLGTGLALWGTWQVSTAAGIFLGARIPAELPLEFTLTLTFIALVVPALKDRAAVAAALMAGLTATVASALPFNLGLVIAALVGIFAGIVVETKFRNGPKTAGDDIQ